MVSFLYDLAKYTFAGLVIGAFLGKAGPWGLVAGVLGTVFFAGAARMLELKEREDERDQHG
ncbi:hypothetical protein D6833_03660 [Candidatus Parcubacteria bacterium]|nr:MAG: hypothetical protein D6833_03660 [Candidatus Parcubacteria bacterium]